MAIVAYDGTYVVDTNKRKLTTIVQPIEKISEKVVDVLTKLIDGDSVDKLYIKLPVRLEKGDTT